MKILMLGNSFTTANRMPDMLAELTGAEDCATYLWRGTIGRTLRRWYAYGPSTQLFSWIMGGIDLKQTLTRKQEESYQCIWNYRKEHGYPPTVREFGKVIGVRSTSSVFFRIKQLEKNGYIRRITASPRAIEIL